jgi:hypothetical protein
LVEVALVGGGVVVEVIAIAVDLVRFSVCGRRV